MIYFSAKRPNIFTASLGSTTETLLSSAVVVSDDDDWQRLLVGRGADAYDAAEEVFEKDVGRVVEKAATCAKKTPMKKRMRVDDVMVDCLLVK